MYIAAFPVSKIMGDLHFNSLLRACLDREVVPLVAWVNSRPQGSLVDTLESWGSWCEHVCACARGSCHLLPPWQRSVASSAGFVGTWEDFVVWISCLLPRLYFSCFQVPGNLNKFPANFSAGPPKTFESRRKFLQVSLILADGGQKTWAYSLRFAGVSGI